MRLLCCRGGLQSCARVGGALRAVGFGVSRLSRVCRRCHPMRGGVFLSRLDGRLHSVAPMLCCVEVVPFARSLVVAENEFAAAVISVFCMWSQARAQSCAVLIARHRPRSFSSRTNVNALLIALPIAHQHPRSFSTRTNVHALLNAHQYPCSSHRAPTSALFVIAHQARASLLCCFYAFVPIWAFRHFFCHQKCGHRIRRAFIAIRS